MRRRWELCERRDRSVSPLSRLLSLALPRSTRILNAMGLLKLGAVAVVWALILGECLCFKKGAPLSRCGTMMPKHGTHRPQERQSDYEVSAAPAAREGFYYVVVKGPPFKGLLLEARANSDLPLGAFPVVTPGYHALHCSERHNSALTHDDNNEKDRVEFEWESPYDYEGDVVFVATVVSNYSTFWTGVKSPVFKVSKRAAPHVNETTMVPTFEQEMYGGCGVDKVCLGSSEECIEQKNCNAIVSVKNVGNSYEFEMLSKGTSKYVAYGISGDNKMGGDAVVECVMKDDGSLSAYRSWNLPNAKQNRRLDDQTGFTIKSIKYEDNTLYCKISQDAVLNVEDITFDLDKNSYYLLLAAGNKLKSDGVGFHDFVYKAAVESRKLSYVGPVKKHDDFYTDCNVLKNCFGVPQDCDKKQNCKAIVSVIATGSKYNFEMKAKSASYVAVGLSEDNKMGGDSVVECVNERNGPVKAYMSWNIPGVKNNTRKSLNQAGITLINGSFIDGDIYCKFSREAKTTVEQKTFDLMKDKYYLLLVSGSSHESDRVGFHDLVYVASDEKGMLSDVGAFVVGSKLLLRLHGAFMVAAWIGAASIGIVLARYYKQTWIGSSMCAKDLWFAWHRFFMLLTWCLTLIGFVLIFIEIGDWVNYRSQIHAILGCVTTILCFIQPIGAAFRPHPTAKNRPIFNWLHWLIGNSAHILAIITIFFAVPIPKVELPEWLDWVLVAYVAFYVVMHIILSFSAFISDRSNGKRVNSFPMKDISSRTPLNSGEPRQDAPHSGFRKFLLSIHITGVLVLCIAIILIIVLAPIEAQWTNLKDKVMSFGDEQKKNSN